MSHLTGTPALLLITVLIACLVADLYFAHSEIARLERAAMECPAVEDHRLADMTIHKPDGSITCQYYKPVAASTRKATMWPPQ